MTLALCKFMVFMTAMHLYVDFTFGAHADWIPDLGGEVLLTFIKRCHASEKQCSWGAQIPCKPVLKNMILLR